MNEVTKIQRIETVIYDFTWLNWPKASAAKMNSNIWAAAIGRSLKTVERALKGLSPCHAMHQFKNEHKGITYRSSTSSYIG